MYVCMQTMLTRTSKYVPICYILHTTHDRTLLYVIHVHYVRSRNNVQPRSSLSHLRTTYDRAFLYVAFASCATMYRNAPNCGPELCKYWSGHIESNSGFLRAYMGIDTHFVCMLYVWMSVVCVYGCLYVVCCMYVVRMVVWKYGRMWAWGYRYPCMHAEIHCSIRYAHSNTYIVLVHNLVHFRYIVVQLANVIYRNARSRVVHKCNK
jgi:hypothetical protein